MKINDDVSPDEDLVNKWRLAKGDLRVAVNARGKISHAVPAKLTIIKDLVRREILPRHYEIYGVGFLELQNAFRAPLKAKCSAVLLEQWGIGVSEGMAAGLYMNVRRQVGTPWVNLIEFLLETMERRKRHVMVKVERRKHEENTHEFTCCFERLVEIMDEEREKLSEVQKNI